MTTHNDLLQAVPGLSSALIRYQQLLKSSRWGADYLQGYIHPFNSLEMMAIDKELNSCGIDLPEQIMAHSMDGLYLSLDFSQVVLADRSSSQTLSPLVISLHFRCTLWGTTPKQTTIMYQERFISSTLPARTLPHTTTTRKQISYSSPNQAQTQKIP